MLEFFFPFSLLNYYASLSNKHNCIFCILHCVSWTTMHAWSTMDGPTWKGKLLLATQIVSYLIIKEQGGTSVALWTTNHTTERQQDYWTEVNCFSQPRHSVCCLFCLIILSSYFKLKFILFIAFCYAVTVSQSLTLPNYLLQITCPPQSPYATLNWSR